MTGDYELMKQLYPKPLSVVGDCSRAMITAADDHELIGADLSSIESRVAAWVAGEEWKLDDLSPLRRDRRSARRALLHHRVQDLRRARRHLQQELAGTQGRQDLRSGISTMQAASARGAISSLTVSPTKRSRRSSRNGARRIRRSCATGSKIDTAAVRAVYHPGEEFVCGPVVLKSDGKFLRIRLPSGRDLCYPNPRLIVDDRDNAKVVYDDNSGGQFAPCRGGFGAYGGIWFENIVSGISRDILVEAMFRIEAAGYPIVLACPRRVRSRSADRFWQRGGIRPPDDAAAVLGARSADRRQCLARLSLRQVGQIGDSPRPLVPLVA